MESVQAEWTFMTDLIKGIAAQFGECCEVVLHDLTRPYDSTIVAIEHGHVTGRKVGDPGTNLGLELLRGERVDGNKFNYVTQTKDGRLLRSTSIYMKDKEGRTIGALCINFDITSLMMAEKTLHGMTMTNLQTDVRESFVTSVGELLDALIQEAQEQVGKPVALMSKEDKVNMVRLLDRKGAFLIKKGGEKIGSYLNISKYTLYSYLEESKQELNKD
ncbi:Predicted transcriptional regulator YheO, contains PAS and DNA-binding HTH domains [Paenibacillus sp. UNCCL117]|uniref:helix-turn-helix transcriptional regulator n=1 Tax=unclassified Paenibacillus TaxID=185978 RepID=UPI00088B74A5|nr:MULTISPECIES: helix-turn-helix transcriptional regulator [unclassified Paenibacillus]SDD63194.1 Predicted transcriptional regulator YheO, contains PAS and DNA-binding HTH domains [Paenibacillus sp. cl123]SFW67751.1 Predicted transcriptional regulator YheO, contains PAS and DNA-binding HTH domains [Paenibacillus sp. UNCCL117]